MSGKPYSIRELKTIVDYVVEHKAYNLIRGRKIWMDFANTQLTNRTWQSLKEALLKRVLPDITNPYYKLTPEQIGSFRRGFNVEERSKTKLDVRKEKGKIEEEQGEPGIEMKSEVERTTGEDNITMTLRACTSDRSSTDTVVLEEVYKTAEDIQKVLESPRPDNNNGDDIDKSPVKSLRDLITYTEPLTPMLQEVLDDFASESEDESRMQIVEDNPKESNDDTANKPEDGETEKRTENSSTIKEKNTETIISAYHVNINKPFRGPDLQKIVEANIDQSDKGESSGVEPIDGSSDCNDVINLCSENDTDEVAETINEVNLSSKNSTDGVTEATKIINNTITSQDKSIENPTQISSNNTTDSIIPNNQEALDGDKTTTKTVENSDSTKCNNIVKVATTDRQKRISSTSSTGKSESRKKTADNTKPIKDTDKNTETNINMDTTKKDKSIETISDAFDRLRENSEPKETEEPSADVSNNKVQNLCLQSVSLYNENYDRGNVSDSSIVEGNCMLQTNNENQFIESVDVREQVVVLNSHSESASSNSPSKSDSNKATTKKQRHKAFAHLFGFSSGAVTSTQKGKPLLPKRKSSFQHAHGEDKSGSSEWTSEDDEQEYVTPPRARKNRMPTRKFLKPKSASVIPLEHEGGLLVFDHKKIVPLMKDGKMIKDYLIFTPHSDSEGEQEAYWKKKYAEEKRKYEEEKKRSDMLMALLEKEKETRPRAMSPPSTNISRKSESRDLVARKISISSGSAEKDLNTIREPNKKETSETIKIKFTKNNEEIQVEGQWQQINTVLQQVVQIFHKDAESEKRNCVSNVPEEKQLPSSGQSRATTPSYPIEDPDVSKKVDQIENEIFQEIVQMDKEENNETVSEVEFVTKRRGKGRKISTSSAPTPSKKQRVSTRIENGVNTSDAAQASTSKRTVRTRKTPSTTPTKTIQQPSVRTRKSKLKKIPTDVDENEVRYMLPSQVTKSKSSLLSSSKEQNINLRSFGEISTSLESTMQGYQDSDFSPHIDHKRKKRTRKLSHTLKTQRRKRFQRYLDIASDSSCSFSGPARNRTDNSSIYKSDSYRILVVKKHPFEVMEAIEEDNVTPKEISRINHFNASHLNQSNSQAGDGISLPQEHSSAHSDSSSMISLPTSPVLSVVENISISRDSLITLDQSLNKVEEVSLPSLPPTDEVPELMATNRQETRKMSIDEPARRSMSDSILDRINKVNIREGSALSDTIGKRLGDLLLDSAKKMSRNIGNEKMEVDVSDEHIKKNKAKKRCSTPRKKKSLNTKFNEIHAVIAEHVDNCSIGGRKSCPPTICVYDCDDNAMSIEDTSPTVYNNKRTKKKKDVIKVKILKPKERRKSDRISRSESKLLDKDSGINVMEAAALDNFDDSVEFIHNHSDTCINANECMGENSVEFIAGNESVISLNNQSTRSCHTWFGPQTENVSHEVVHKADVELVLNDLDSGLSVKDKNSIEEILSPNSTEASYNSLLTEDLSDETPVNIEASKLPKLSNWFLLSEDESTNFLNREHSSAGSNLTKLFPITYAVPDLSTITEMSRENGENSRKATIGNCENGSQNIQPP